MAPGALAGESRGLLREMLVRAGEKEKAKQMAEAQAKFGPRNTVATAEAYIQAGDFEDAIAFVKGSLKTKPEDLDLLVPTVNQLLQEHDRRLPQSASATP